MFFAEVKDFVHITTAPLKTVMFEYGHSLFLLFLKYYNPLSLLNGWISVVQPAFVAFICVYTKKKKVFYS